MSITGYARSDGRDDQARFFFSRQSPFYIGDLPNVELTISAHSYFSVWPVEWQVRSRILADSMIREANPDLGAGQLCAFYTTRHGADQM